MQYVRGTSPSRNLLIYKNAGISQLTPHDSRVLRVHARSLCANVLHMYTRETASGYKQDKTHQSINQTLDLGSKLIRDKNRVDRLFSENFSKITDKGNTIARDIIVYQWKVHLT